MRAWWLVAAAGCGNKGDSGAAPLYEYIGECDSDAAPVVADMFCESTGIQTYPVTGEDVPTLTISADVSDEDGDLTSYTAQVFFDETLDGVMDTSAGELSSADGSYHADVCTVPSLILNMVVYLRGGEPLYDTTYEWGLQVTDAGGNASEIGVVECTTPSEKTGDTNE
jgi:hypothetical protein